MSGMWVALIHFQRCFASYRFVCEGPPTWVGRRFDVPFRGGYWDEGELNKAQGCFVSDGLCVCSFDSLVVLCVFHLLIRFVCFVSFPGRSFAQKLWAHLKQRLASRNRVPPLLGC